MKKVMIATLLFVLAGLSWWFYQFQQGIVLGNATRNLDLTLANEENRSFGKAVPTREYRHRDYGDIKFFYQDTRTSSANTNDTASSAVNSVQKKMAAALQGIVGSINPETDDDESFTTIVPPSQNGLNQKRTTWSLQEMAPAANAAPPPNNSPAPNASNMQNRPASAPPQPSAPNKP